MNSLKAIKNWGVGVLALSMMVASGAVWAQHSVSFSDETGTPGATVTVDFEFTNTGGDSALEARARIVPDISAFSSIDESNLCADANADFVSCTINDTNRIVVTATNFDAADPIPDWTGSIDFVIDPAVAPLPQTVTLEWNHADDSGLTFTPTDSTDGSIEIVDASAVLNAQPPSIAFPATENGTSSAPETITISNDGSDGIDMEVTGVSLATGTHFSISANTCGATPFTLSDGESCTYDAVFSPTATGNFNDTVTVTSDAGQTTNGEVALSGEGTLGPAANLAISPASHDYGDVLTGESSSQTFTVSNDGESGSDVSIDAITPPGGDFSVTGGTCSAGSTNLSDGASCTIMLEFAPAADGAQSGDLVVDGTDTVNSTAQQAIAAVQGNGVTEARFSSNPAPGAVSLGQTVPGGTLDQDVVITNEGNASLDASCGTLNDPDGVFTLTPSPADFTGIAAGASESFNVACTVPDVNSYEATLQCSTNEGTEGQIYDYTFRCSGRPLAVPTMQPWGLVVLTMLMLMVGGLSIRYFRV